MTRFETPSQVVLLFASVVLVALLNVEARNRKSKEPENGRWVIKWRHHGGGNSSLGRVKRSNDPPLRHHGKHHPQNLTSCYTTNQVLLVIAVTCAVNFAFIFVVMALVHVCNRDKGLDSAVLAEGGEEYSLLSRTSSQESLLKKSGTSFSMEDLLSWGAQ